jgi:hypothetical protein
MPLHTVDEAEVDEMWSWVGKNTHQRGLWPAMAHRTGVVVASCMGDPAGRRLLTGQSVVRPMGHASWLHRWCRRVCSSSRARTPYRGQTIDAHDCTDPSHLPNTAATARAQDDRFFQIGAAAGHRGRVVGQSRGIRQSVMNNVTTYVKHYRWAVDTRTTGPRPGESSCWGDGTGQVPGSWSSAHCRRNWYAASHRRAPSLRAIPRRRICQGVFMDSACVSSVCYAGGYLDEWFRAAAAAAATRSVGLLPTECSRSCQLRSYHRTLHERMERGHGVGPEHQVTKAPQRVERSVAISLMAYLMLLKFRAPISQRRVPGVCLPSNATSRGRPPSNACANASRSVKLHDQTGVPVVFKKLSTGSHEKVSGFA